MVASLVHLSSASLYFANALELDFYPRWLRISEGLVALSALLAIGAYVEARAGFLRAPSRPRLLGLAAIFFAASGAGALADHVIRSVQYSGHGVAGTFAAAEIVGAAASMAFVSAGVVAAVAFLSTTDSSRRDPLLGCAAVGLVAYFGLTFVHFLLYAVGYSRGPAPGGFIGGLAMQAAGAAVGGLGPVLAAVAFLRADPDGELQRLAVRERLLAEAALTVGLGYLVTAIGALVYAGSISDFETDSKQIAANWLNGVGYVGLMCVAICAGLAFRASRRALEERDGPDPAAFADPG
jgi:hypothetical protein